MSDVQRTLASLEAGSVVRYHAASTVRPQTVGHHSHGVAVLCIYLCGDHKLMLRDVLQAAVLHDTAELFTGDIPFTTKRACPELKVLCDKIEQEVFATKVLPMPQLTDSQECILKLADTLDGLIWCWKHENTNGAVFKRWSESFKQCLVKFQGRVPPDVLERALQLSNSLTPNYLFP